jgi:UDP-N-acetylmuramyl pentapeptide phosphotransferase/UDP-N-acetylglucosamine-1-phosphate transferase
MKPDLLIAGPIVACAALALAWVLLRLLNPLFSRYALARPNARSSHKTPTPQGGGIAVIVSTLVIALAAALSMALDSSLLTRLLIVAAAAVFIAAVGVVDDLKELPVAPRFAFQALAAGAIVMALPDGLRIASFVPLWIERALLLVAILWFVNLTNFMDGIDWITVAEVVPIAAGLAVLGLTGALPVHSALVAFALLGAVIGFAPYNKPVARLFLGDVGSLPIGLLLGWMLVLLAGNGHIAAALLLPLYYLADATITLLRRIMRRERVWEAHRTHFYQQAFDGGMPIGAILSRIFLTNIVLAILALISVRIGSAGAQAATLALGVVAVTALLAGFARRRA